MPTHAEERLLRYRPDQLFDLVADVERYPEFLPWCAGVRVIQREDSVILADMLVGFKMVRERFTSRVSLDPPHRIDVVYLHGPFRHLNNHWIFKPRDGGCLIDFHIDFEFRSRILRAMMGPLFNEAVRRMVGAFETRAGTLYGTSGRDAPPVCARSRAFQK